MSVGFLPRTEEVYQEDRSEVYRINNIVGRIDCASRGNVSTVNIVPSPAGYMQTHLQRIQSTNLPQK